jgi:chromosome segregation ATPase
MQNPTIVELERQVARAKRKLEKLLAKGAELDHAAENLEERITDWEHNLHAAQQALADAQTSLNPLASLMIGTVIAFDMQLRELDEASRLYAARKRRDGWAIVGNALMFTDVELVALMRGAFAMTNVRVLGVTTRSIDVTL